MRKNLPVTDREYVYASEDTLVSVTDTKGRITYCNPAFVTVSGFEINELLGQPHNLIRHPEVPSQAFEDLWHTVQKGQPWTGVIKNRRKNGDFYWVQANVTPMRDGDNITGYLSVRTLPSREQVQQSQALYESMNADQAAGRRLRYILRQGQVYPHSLWGRLQQALRPTVVGLLLLLQMGMVAFTLVPVLLGAPWWLSLVLAVLTVGLGVSLTRKIAVWALTDLLEDANYLASGDLTRTVRTGGFGRIGMVQRALFQLSVNLRTVVGDVRTEVLRLEQAVQAIAEGNHDLSTRTHTQASNLESTASALEEITGTVQSSASSAGDGAQLAARTSSLAQHGHQAVQQVDSAMTAIAHSSEAIQGIVQTIESVAFQTNLLALNAAVEAARAGEQGRGFAIVATEVRALAGRTTEAAHTIRQLIEQARERVALGTQASEDARKRMDQTLEAVRQVDHLLGSISTAAHEQQLGVSQINHAVADLDAITQDNLALVQQVDATAKSLCEQVGSVRSTMRLLRLHSSDVSLSQQDAVALRRMCNQSEQRA
ncbi:MAG: PAS domain-containing protein [Comamonas sp.]|nr:PAS domain-containing protein [Comamonas sp.]